ncbi:MAG: chalcone isomerase family protein [Actinomycetota bacterium]|nr:chalcone isomerase family protein [Actinomycetota bacterium]
MTTRDPNGAGWTGAPHRPARPRWRSVAVVAAMLVAFAPSAAAYEVSGVSFDRSQLVAGRPLALSGYGLHRYRLFIKLYAMALYVDPASQVADVRGDMSAEVVLDEDVPKRLELETFWAIPADIFRRLTRERIEGAVTPGEYAQLAPQVEALNALYEDVEPGDRYAITYVPGLGTELAKNGESKGVVAGEEFARAMFGIWLGEKPFDRKLRAQLLEDRK